MIFDLRSYTLVPRKMAAYLALVEEFALPCMLDHGMRLEHYMIGKIGPLNTVVHLWRYESLAAFEIIRGNRDADPRWSDYLKRTEGMVQSQSNQILGEASFSPNALGK